MQINPIVIYKINKEDEIIYLNDAWNNFALKNDAPELTDEKVLNRSLWDFITDDTTRQLYEEMLLMARTGRVLKFIFKCDSPENVRQMLMTISAEKDGGVQFQTRILSTGEQRFPQRILDRSASRSDDLATICGWCKAIDTGNKQWLDVDDAVSSMGLFNQAELPKLTHGMCDNCYAAILGKISERNSL